MKNLKEIGLLVCISFFTCTIYPGNTSKKPYNLDKAITEEKIELVFKQPAKFFEDIRSGLSPDDPLYLPVGPEKYKPIYTVIIKRSTKLTPDDSMGDTWFIMKSADNKLYAFPFGIHEKIRDQIPTKKPFSITQKSWNVIESWYNNYPPKDPVSDRGKTFTEQDIDTIIDDLSGSSPRYKVTFKKGIAPAQEQELFRVLFIVEDKEDKPYIKTTDIRPLYYPISTKMYDFIKNLYQKKYLPQINPNTFPNKQNITSVINTMSGWGAHLKVGNGTLEKQYIVQFKDQKVPWIYSKDKQGKFTAFPQVRPKNRKKHTITPPTFKLIEKIYTESFKPSNT